MRQSFVIKSITLRALRWSCYLLFFAVWRLRFVCTNMCYRTHMHPTTQKYTIQPNAFIISTQRLCTNIDVDARYVSYDVNLLDCNFSFSWFGLVWSLSVRMRALAVSTLILFLFHKRALCCFRCQYQLCAVTGTQNKSTRSNWTAHNLVTFSARQCWC